ncbi:MAG: type II toxin-antitoxin system RelE family toxin [Vicingaceae bacterium]
MKHLKDKKLIDKITATVNGLKAAKSFENIKGIKKMKSKNIVAYRIRIGDYRLGFYVNNDVITLARFIKRNDIYKVFP